MMENNQGQKKIHSFTEFSGEKKEKNYIFKWVSGPCFQEPTFTDAVG